jgi:hypothetical protein
MGTRPYDLAILLVPAVPRLYSDLDRNLGHHRRYTWRGVTEQLEACGFTIVEGRYLNKLGALGWLINGRILHRQVLPPLQMRLFSRLVPLLSWFDRLPLSFGLSVFVIAERPRR